jgi:hypothetical protein
MALFHSAVFAGLLFLPPPVPTSSLSLVAVSRTPVRQPVAASFSARAPPLPI